MKSELENQKETTDGINNPDTTDETIWDDEELDIPDEMVDEIFDLPPNESNKTSERPIPFYKDGFVPPASQHSGKENIFETPQKIYKYLNEQVYGIDEYKRQLSIFFWKCFHNKRPSGALLICGPSGCGKTEAVRAISRHYENLVIIDGSAITAQGWKGESKLCTPLKNLDFSESAKTAVYVIDEVDKLLAKSRYSESGIVFELLKLLEGGVVNTGTEIAPKFVDTSRVAFILLGSFSGITDVKKSSPIGFGAIRDDTPVKLTKEAIDSLLIPEIRGRIENTVVISEPFNEKDLLNILSHSNKFSPIRRISNDLNIRLYVSKERAERIAHNAFVSHTGVRSMNNEINRAVNEILFENPDAKRIYIK